MSFKWPEHGPAPYAFSITGPATDMKAPAVVAAAALVKNFRRDIPSIDFSFTAVPPLGPFGHPGFPMAVNSPACRVGRRVRGVGFARQFWWGGRDFPPRA